MKVLLVAARRKWPVAKASMLALVLVACFSATEERPTGSGSFTRVVHAEEDGPLSASSGAGALSIAAPRDAPWSGSFGFMLLCRTAGFDGEIELQGVRPEFGVEPATEAFAVREVSAAQYASDERFSPFNSVMGAPPFEEPEADFHALGAFADVRGVRVSQSCRSGAEVADSGFQELIVTLRVGKRGGSIRSTLLDYAYDGREYALEIDWEMVVCGSSPELATMCDRN